MRTYAYRVYVTDSLQAAVQKRYLTVRWDDIIHRNTDTRTGDEIAADIVSRAGLVLAEKGEENA